MKKALTAFGSLVVFAFTCYLVGLAAAWLVYISIGPTTWADNFGVFVGLASAVIVPLAMQEENPQETTYE